VLADGRVVPAPRALAAALAVSTAAIVLLNAPIDTAALLAALAGAALMLAAAGALRLRWLPRALALVPFFELAPAAILVYVYFAWGAAAHATLAPGEVLPVVGIVWTNWEFWKFSRGVGKSAVERIYGLRSTGTRAVLGALLALSLAFSLALYSAARLSPLYLGYALALIVLAAASIARFAAADPARPRQPWWAGLAFPNAITLGLLVQLLAFL
jgi:hypothetical protein